MSVTKVQASEEFAPQVIMGALTDTTTFSNPVKALVLFYCYEVTPGELIGRVEFFNSAVRRVQWPRTKPEPEPKYQSIFFKHDQMIALFEKLIAVGKDFGCEDPVREHMRLVAHTCYTHHHPDGDLLSWGSNSHASKGIFWKFHLAEQISSAKANFKSGACAYVPPDLAKLDELLGASSVHHPTREIEIAFDQIDQMDLDNRSVPKGLKEVAHKTEEERVRAIQLELRARGFEIEEMQQETCDDYCFNFCSYILDALFCVFKFLCCLVCRTREEG